jgi:hypothetical protein
MAMKSSRILTLGAVALLAACSDGNGFTEDKSGNNNNGGGAGNGSITVANAMAVTKITFESALVAGIAAEFTGGTGVLAVDPGPSVALQPRSIDKLNSGFAAAISPNAASAYVPIPPTVENCLEGGTTTLSGEIADPFTPVFTPGDYFDIVYSNCNDGFSTVNGALLYTVDSFVGDLAGFYDLTMTATFTDFQVANSEDTLVSNGDVTVRLNSLNYPLVSADTSGTSLTVDGNNFTMTMTNFAGFYSQDVEAVPSPFSQGSSGTMNNSLLPNIVDYSTPEAFTGFDGEYPSNGEFFVMAPNSSARLVAVDNVAIQILIDTNGDGVIDETINSTWAELDSL